MQINSELNSEIIAVYKNKLDGGKLVLVNGTKPSGETAADLAINLATHTILATITADAGVGAVGLTWDTPGGNYILKPAAATWSSATPAFNGVDDGETTLAANFALWLPRTAVPTAPPAGGECRMLLNVSGAAGTSDIVLMGGTSITAGGTAATATFARVVQPFGTIV